MYICSRSVHVKSYSLHIIVYWLHVNARHPQRSSQLILHPLPFNIILFYPDLYRFLGWCLIRGFRISFTGSCFAAWSDGWVPGVQALMITALITGTFMDLASNAYVFMPKLDQCHAVVFVSTCLAFTTGESCAAHHSKRKKQKKKTAKKKL